MKRTARVALVGAGLLTVWLLAVPDPSSAGVFDKTKKVFSKKEKAEAFVPSGGWEAYIHDDEGNDRPLLQPVEKNEDKDWMFLAFTDYKGPRKRLAVMEVENRTASAEQGEISLQTLLGRRTAAVDVAAIEELLTTSLFNTNRFNLVERKALQPVLAEQDFGDSGRVSAPTAAKIGKVQGAEYLIFAAVNEWTPEKDRVGGGGVGGGGGVLGAIGAGKSTAEVAMSFRVVDAASGQVLISLTERAQAGSWGISFGGAGSGIGGGGVGFQRSSPIGYAVQACISKIAYKIAMSLKDRPWSGTVVQVKGDQIYINAGSNAGVEVGTRLVCMAKGEELIDPDTGLSLGADTTAIGNLQITTVKDAFSIATVVQGCKGLKPGDQVEISSSAGP